LNNREKRKCKGKGIVKNVVMEKINVPKGTIHGSEMRFRRKGQADGDLIIRFLVKRDDVYKLVGYDVKTELKITKEQALKGAEIMVDTLYGKHKVVIPANTKKEYIHEIPRFGIQHAPPNHHLKGDHLINVKIE